MTTMDGNTEAVEEQGQEEAAGTEEQPGRDAAGRFVKGHAEQSKHGGEGAVRALQLGLPMRGLAHDVELAVYDELEQRGRYALMVRNAVRLQVAADLFWDAVDYATQEKSLKLLDKYVKRFGWLAAAANRALIQVREEAQASDDAALIIDAISSAHKLRGEDGQADDGD